MEEDGLIITGLIRILTVPIFAENSVGHVEDRNGCQGDRYTNELSHRQV
jgi:hypothetical protein